MKNQLLSVKRLVQIIIVVMLSIVMCAGPLYAQVGRSRTFERPLEKDSGQSFRSVGQGTNKQGEMEIIPSSIVGPPPGVITEVPTATSMAGFLMYQVHILGEVNKPGTYRVMASERLSEVLDRAGGAADSGSVRRVEIRRDGKTVKTVDLLRFKVDGKLDHNPYLLDNDVVYVPLKNKSIQVVGAVKRPETYELLNEKNVWEVINLAGGFSTGVSTTEPVRIIRFENGKKNILEVESNKLALSDQKIENGDVVFVSNVITEGHKFDYDISKIPGDNIFYPSYEDRVFVLGGVEMPGPYPFNPYYNIHQYISLAGGYSMLSTKRVSVLTQEAKRKKVRGNKPIKVNPGDTILVGERRIPPEGWVSLFMSLGSFGLSTTATVLTLTK